LLLNQEADRTSWHSSSSCI